MNNANAPTPTITSGDIDNAPRSFDVSNSVVSSSGDAVVPPVPPVAPAPPVADNEMDGSDNGDVNGIGNGAVEIADFGTTTFA